MTFSADDPSAEEFAALSLVVSRLPQLWPELPDESVERNWKDTEGFRMEYEAMFKELSWYLDTLSFNEADQRALVACERRFSELIDFHERLKPMGFGKGISSGARDVNSYNNIHYVHKSLRSILLCVSCN